jgi:tetratricopeptide (TPR) repeat protein
MGLLYYQMGDKARAEQFMEIALGSSDRDNPVYDEMAVNYAALLLETGRSGKALVILNKIIADSPRYARAYSNRAVLYYLHHDFAAARADAETALRLDPKNTQAQTLLKKELK